MGKRVVVVASGATEQKALPHLCRHLSGDDVQLLKVVTPPGHKQIRPALATQLIRAAWFGWAHAGGADKFVVLLDADAHDPEVVAGPVREACGGMQDIPVPICVTAAQRHLEAWFFADPVGLRRHLSNRALGNIRDAPDQMENPKQHLRNLLAPDFYTSLRAGAIAADLDPAAIEDRSPSFKRLAAAMRNGLPPRA
ncbi:MAG: DUF4276 family protein [Terriglobales bacterium]